MYKALSAEEMELERLIKQGQLCCLKRQIKEVTILGLSSVRLTSLGEFGSPQFEADKLIEAEKLKESTKEAEVIGVTERSGQGGLQVYEFEGKVDSTRGGMKIIFSAVFVASKKLYLLNIAHSDKHENPLDSDKRMTLEQILHSLDAVRHNINIKSSMTMTKYSLALGEMFISKRIFCVAWLCGTSV
ncbi:PsbP domain-containing protein [Quillaja saponaria]|uniref:PsbP domain-containing protein n=1 Tax=Quillaja saponaria TaxID=32244 RepID=A0AAD7LH85_QUISA|nr:PsbP domain-containing protein [Quillaja saponaria]